MGWNRFEKLYWSSLNRSFRPQEEALCRPPDYNAPRIFLNGRTSGPFLGACNKVKQVGEHLVQIQIARLAGRGSGPETSLQRRGGK